jgi:hypothetical protein
MKKNTNSWLNWLGEFYWPAIAGLVCLAVYIATGAVTLSWANYGNDGGDLMLAVATGGVPHPPGFPLYLLLSKLASWLLPLPNLAWKMNVLSAIGGAVTVTFLAAAASRFVHWKPAAYIGALTYAFAALPWSQATITEVSTWMAAFLAVGIYCFIKAVSGHPDATIPVSPSTRRWLLAAWLICGLGVAIHPIALVGAPLLAVGMWRFRMLRLPFKVWVSYAVTFILPLALYGILYLRAQAHPAYQWVVLDSAQDFWRYLTFQQYWGNVTSQALFLLKGLAKYGLEVWRNLGGASVVVGVLGLVVIRKIRRDLTWWLVASLILFAAPVIVHNENPVLGGYYTVSLLPWALLVAVGCSFIAERLDSRSIKPWIICLLVTVGLVLSSFSTSRLWLATLILLVIVAWLGYRRDRPVYWLLWVLPLLLLAGNWWTINIHGDHRFDRIMQMVNADVPPNTLIVTIDGSAGPQAVDAMVFALKYGFMVHTPRPDVVVDYNFSAQRLPIVERLYPKYNWTAFHDEDQSPDKQFIRFIEDNRSVGAVYFTFAKRFNFSSEANLGDLRLRQLPDGLLYELIPPTYTPSSTLR